MSYCGRLRDWSNMAQSPLLHSRRHRQHHGNSHDGQEECQNFRATLSPRSLNININPPSYGNSHAHPSKPGSDGDEPLEGSSPRYVTPGLRVDGHSFQQATNPRRSWPATLRPAAGESLGQETAPTRRLRSQRRRRRRQGPHARAICICRVRQRARQLQVLPRTGAPSSRRLHLHFPRRDRRSVAGAGAPRERAGCAAGEHLL